MQAQEGAVGRRTSSWPRFPVDTLECVRKALAAGRAELVKLWFAAWKTWWKFLQLEGRPRSRYILPVCEVYVSNAKNIFSPWDTAECERHVS